MAKNSLAICLSLCLGVSLVVPVVSHAEDLLQSTMERMQIGMDQLIGDGTFDNSDEDICLIVLGNSAYQRQQVMIDAVESDLNDVRARGRVGDLTTSAIDVRMLYFHLRDVIEDRREIPPFERLSTEETERLSFACSVIVKSFLEDASAEVALQARGRAELWVVSELIAALAERSNR